MKSVAVAVVLLTALLAVRPGAALPALRKRQVGVQTTATPHPIKRRSSSRKRLLTLRGGDSTYFAKTTEVLGWLDLIGTGVFAFSGTVAAGKDEMDLLGCTIISVVTSIGGGTVRDLLLGRRPVFWIREPIFLAICIVTSAVTFALWPFLETHFSVRTDASLLWMADAIGMGAFTVLGAQAANSDGHAALICIACGLMSACFGGVLRDVLCRRSVRILHADKSMYATPALLGACLFIFLDRLAPQHEGLDAFCGFALAVAARVLAGTYDLRLPSWLNHPHHKPLNPASLSGSGLAVETQFTGTGCEEEELLVAGRATVKGRGGGGGGGAAAAREEAEELIVGVGLAMENLSLSPQWPQQLPHLHGEVHEYPGTFGVGYVDLSNATMVPALAVRTG